MVWRRLPSSTRLVIRAPGRFCSRRPRCVPQVWAFRSSSRPWGPERGWPVMSATRRLEGPPTALDAKPRRARQSLGFNGQVEHCPQQTQVRVPGGVAEPALVQGKPMAQVHRGNVSDLGAQPLGPSALENSQQAPPVLSDSGGVAVEALIVELDECLQGQWAGGTEGKRRCRLQFLRQPLPGRHPVGRSQAAPDRSAVELENPVEHPGGPVAKQAMPIASETWTPGGAVRTKDRIGAG